VRYLVDEDLSPDVAAIARGLGLDAVSVHELGRCGLPDEEQFGFAIEQNRIVVTRNRDDFIALVASAFAAGKHAPGVLIVPSTISASPPSLVAHALQRWASRYEGTEGPGLCVCDFLS
jgi:predicted nuclease of predicted toxin-antitoxin system